MSLPITGLSRIATGVDMTVVGHKIPFPRQTALLNGKLVKQLNLDQYTQLTRSFERFADFYLHAPLEPLGVEILRVFEGDGVINEDDECASEYCGRE